MIAKIIQIETQNHVPDYVVRLNFTEGDINIIKDYNLSLATKEEVEQFIQDEGKKLSASIAVREELKTLVNQDILIVTEEIKE